MFSQSEPARAERYLSMYRSVSTSVNLAVGWQGDRRVRALQLYPHAVATLRLGEFDAAIVMLEEAWRLFSELDYLWRAALAALDLYKATGKGEWLRHAREQIAPWPKSWIARDVREAHQLGTWPT